MVIVIADHGHRLSEPIYLEKEYPQIMENARKEQHL